MLARYAADFAVFREVVQNADDANASSFELHLSFNLSGDVTGMEAKNDGRLFNEKDWSRVAKIAEGNPDEQTVGMFGVGFYSVFSFTEQPLIKSGDRGLLFYWRGDQLATSAAAVEYSKWTSILMEFREPQFWKLNELAAFFQKTMLFTKTVSSIRIFADPGTGKPVEIFKVRKECTQPRVNALAGKIRTKFLSASDFHVSDFSITCQSRLLTDSPTRGKKQVLTSVSAPWRICDVHLRLVTLRAVVKLEKKFSEQVLRIMKKALPASTTIKLVLDNVSPHGGLLAASQEGYCASDSAALRAVLSPSYVEKGPSANMWPAGQSGRVFVGLATHQTTGGGFHLHAQLVPTVERENIGILHYLPGGGCACYYLKCTATLILRSHNLNLSLFSNVSTIKASCWQVHQLGSLFHLRRSLFHHHPTPPVSRCPIPPPDFVDPYLGQWNADVMLAAGRLLREVHALWHAPYAASTPTPATSRTASRRKNGKGKASSTGKQENVSAQWLPPLGWLNDQAPQESVLGVALPAAASSSSKRGSSKGAVCTAAATPTAAAAAEGGLSAVQQCAHFLAAFSIRGSTPSGRVGDLLLQGFKVQC